MNNPASPTQTFSGNPAAEDHTETRLIQHRLLLLKVYGCIKSFEDSSGYMPSDRQEFRDLELVGEDIAGVLGI